MGFPGGSDGKESACQCRRHGFDPWVGKLPLEKEMATHSSILAWRIPCTEDPGGLQSMGLQRVRHDWATNTHITNIFFLSVSIMDCHRLNVCVLPKFFCWCLNPDSDSIWEVVGFEWGHADGTPLWDWSPGKGTKRPNFFFLCHVRKPTRGLLPELVHAGTLILYLLSLQNCAKWMRYLSHSVYGILVVATQAD